MKRFIALLLIGWSAAGIAAVDLHGTEHHVRPGDDPQVVLDRANPGDRVVILPGMHLRPLGRHQSMLYVDKPISIILAKGATLKLADQQTVLLADAEITTDHSAKKIDDLEMGGEYDRKRGAMMLTIRITSEGVEGGADTFSWAFGTSGKPVQAKVAITGKWQPLTNGIKVRFGQTRGHNKGAFWFVSYDGPASYGIRVGHGTQEKYIENVSIDGRGTIDLNSQNNVQPSGMVKDISACVLVHGRVRNVHIEGITMTNTMRSVMLYGEHTGKFLPGGGVQGGESFDAESISILSTRTINPDGAAYLLGHPSHRGHLRNVRCNFNTMESKTTSIEPNFNLDGYEVIGNLIKSGGLAVHCWRRSTNGKIEDNVRFGDAAGRPVVVNNAPSGWKASEKLTFSGNINLQKGEFPATFAGLANQSADHFMLLMVTDNAALQTLKITEERPLVLPDGARSTYRILLLTRSEEGDNYAAFSASGKVQRGPDGLVLLDDWTLPLSRSNNAIKVNVRPDPEGNSLQVEVRGLPGVRLMWVGHFELETGTAAKLSVFRLLSGCAVFSDCNSGTPTPILR